MSEAPEIQLRIITPYGGYRRYTTFNRYFVDDFDEYLMVSFGLIRGRGHLGELHALLDKKMLLQCRDANMHYVDTLFTQGQKAIEAVPWEPLLPATELPPVVNQMAMSHVQGVGEINLLNYSRRAVWDEYQKNKHAPQREIVVEPDAYALLTSTISLQISFILKIYSFFKPDPPV